MKWQYWIVVVSVALVAFACPARGQDFSVTFRPMPLRASEALLGGKEYGLWTVEIEWKNPALPLHPLTRKEILDLGVLDDRPIPFIADATLAEDLIENRVYLSKPAKFGRAIVATKRIAGPGLSIAGWATDVPGLGWAGLGLLVFDVANELAKGREPNPQNVVKSLMPPIIVLVNGQASHTLLSAKMPNARALLDVRPKLSLDSRVGILVTATPIDPTNVCSWDPRGQVYQCSDHTVFVPNSGERPISFERSRDIWELASRK